mmetsp:Transcript_10961/g.16940  ORF Transcript_10961/g.16940 Transcript_10961/m.16940 type:complete len:217 (+) Transcript_10961:273-923(+)
MSQAVIELNNHALTLLQEQNYAQAVLAFKDTFRLVVTETRQRRDQSQERPQNNGRLPTFSALTWTDPFIARDGHHNVGSNCNYYVFTRALIVRGQPIDEAELPIAVLYNFALSIHLHSLRIGAPGRSLQNKALELYEQALNLRTNPMIQSVVLHNVGLIHYELGQYEQTRACFQWLENAAAAGREEFQPPKLPNEDYQHVLLNVKYLTEPSVAGAA